MALVYADRVWETSTTTGLGTLNLAGAVGYHRTFVAGVGTGNTCKYAIVNQSANEWEIGTGTVTDAVPDTLSRTTIHASTNGGAAVNFSAGTKDVFLALPGTVLDALTPFAVYNTNGLLTQTAASTFTGRTITGTAAEITATNGDGVSGNPTLSLPTALTFTGKTVTGGTLATSEIKGYVETAQASANSGTAITIGAYTTGVVVLITLTGSPTITLPTGPATSNTVMSMTIKLLQDATGSHAVVWAAPVGDSIKWTGTGSDPGVNATANKTTIYTVLKFNGDPVWYMAQVWKEA